MSQSGRWIGSGLAIASLVALSGGAALAQEAPVTLTLAVADQTDRPSFPVVRDFVDAVALLSDRSVTIEPLFDAAGDGFEVGTARILLDGGADLALVASRAWADAGVPVLEPLQTPFLVDSDGLAVAIPTSDVGRSLLDALSPHGVVGLSMWPEDLRHPVSLEGCADPLITPDAFEGLTIRTTGSTTTSRLIETLGASVAAEYEGDCRVHGGESGLRQGTSIPPAFRPTFTGDVTFSTKFQVLVANGASFERLSDAQRDVIREAAAYAADRAIDARPTDAQAAAEWCASRGDVVIAGPGAIAAFEAAARPVVDRIASDVEAARAIEAIRALESSAPVLPGAQACEFVDDATAPAPVAVTSEVPADGSWRIDVTPEAMAAAGLSADEIANVAAVYTWTFRSGPDDGSGTFVMHGQSPVWGSLDCDGEYQLNPDGSLLVRFVTIANCGGSQMLWAWSTDSDEAARVSVIDTPGMDPTVDRAMWESAPLVRVD
jgi:TRAP-type C4-dicarboxylate transport system substrate-binding protein